MSKPAMPLVHRALRRAVKAHRKQDRDGVDPLPYATHPVEVMTLLRYTAGVTDPEVLAAGVLHDVVEQSDESMKDIEGKFGGRVARLVGEMTRVKPDVSTLTPEEAAQVQTNVLLEDIDAMSEEGKIVKLADRLSNAGVNLVERKGDQLVKYVKQTRLILDHIDRGVNPPLWDRLNDLIQHQEGLQRSKPNSNGGKKKVETVAT